MAHRRVTIDDIARESQASPTTVSLVLRDKPGISAETRQRVLAVARTLGYQHRGPNRASGATEPLSVALIVRTQLRYGEGALPNINPFYSWVLAGIESAARAREINLLYATLTTDEDNRHVDLPSHLLQQPLDGVLLVGAFLPETVRAITAARSGPIVLVDAATGGPDLDAVVTDNLRGAMDAVEHLASLGHRQIVFLGPPEGINPNFDQRRAGYRSVLAARGLAPMEGHILRNDLDEAVTDVRARFPDATAIFATNDRFASGTIAALERLGLTIPDDMSVMGFDNIEPGAGMVSTLTTMAVDKGSLGRLAIEALRYRLSWPEASEVMISLRPRLTQRASVAAPGVREAIGEAAVVAR
jgi:DNA-binding LacI/PurR family transcriptional regulator